MKRIILHWTGGTYNASTVDKRHYHTITQGDGVTVEGDLLPEANKSPLGPIYAAHTRGANSDAIGMAVAGMHGAREAPFSAGVYPIKQEQLEAFAQAVADMAQTYGIPITRRTVLTHAEVQVTLGIAQRGKWDITWLPGWSRPRDPVEAGDALRAMIRAHIEPEPVEDSTTHTILSWLLATVLRRKHNR